MATKNPMGRSRKPETAYITSVDVRLPGWEWKVLKTYQVDGHKPYARALCAVTSPYTGGSFDLGDTYVTEIGHTITDFDREVFPDERTAFKALFGG